MELTQFEAFLLSTLIEAAAGAGLLAAQERTRMLRGALAAVLGTALTHPILWAVLPLAENLAGYWLAVVALETCIVLIEAIVWRLVAAPRWPAALLYSLAANLASLAVGLLIQGW